MVYAAITFQTLPDRSFENGVVTDEKGYLTYDGQAQKYYLLSVSCIEYGEKHLNLTTDKPVVDAVIIQKKEEALRLSEVTVTATREAVI